MLKRFMVRSMVCFACLGAFGCQTSASSESGDKVSATSPHAAIWIAQDGKIELNGQVADLAAIDKGLSDLAQRKGIVLYGRDAASGEPHPNAMEVIKRVASHRLPIRMSTKRDFSDAVQ